MPDLNRQCSQQQRHAHPDPGPAPGQPYQAGPGQRQGPGEVGPDLRGGDEGRGGHVPHQGGMWVSDGG
ncbi:MAG TPA: hypothetical protein VF498_19865, partial [Anaerolineales bacterium]